jgi:Tfp pilus assembly PilM family ATPase
MFGRKKSRLIGKRFVAVDFDSNHLHVVEGERVARNLRVGRLSAVEIPEDVDVTDAQQFGAFLGGVLKKMKLSGASLLMTVNRADAVFKPLTLPPGTDPEEMAGMVQFQMQGELPYRAEEAVIDFTGESHYDAESDQPEESAGIDLLVAAVKLPIVDRYRQVANAAGAKLVRLGLRPYADRSCAIACLGQRADESVAIVHITADETEIDVASGASLTFSRPAVVKVPHDPEPDEAEAVVSDVTIEVARSLRSYTAVEGQQRIDRAVVAGSTGIEQQVAEALSDRLRLPVEKLDPTESFRIRELSGDADPSAFITALGLAVGGRGDELPFDFLSPKQPVARRDTRRLRIGALAVAAVLTIAAALTWYHKMIIAPRERTKLSLQRKLRFQEAIADARKVELQRVQLQQEFQARSHDYLRNLAGVWAALPPADQVYVRRFRSVENGFSFEVYGSELNVIQTALRERLESAGYSVKIDDSVRMERPRDPRYGHRADVTVTFEDANEVDLVSLQAPPRPADDISARKGYRP